MHDEVSSIEGIIAAIDDLHRRDPIGAELGYAQRMSHWLMELDSDPSPALVIAVRAQHLKRWECPRSEFPAGRAGYLRWRRNAAAHHARLVTQLLETFESDRALIDRVGALVEKRCRDRDGQTLEDCACLVFLETRLADFRDEHAAPDVARILGKAWQKMSSAARALATARALI
ncbi:MAG: DUF4202 domain-containing protein [Gammaproteobacteria bacterium]|nr:DUF4202 domain-containing protein [Gammaproteobacteria bacterium]